MKKIFMVYDERVGAEAAFDEDGKMLGGWHENDACWREEYFEELMRALGVTVVRSNDPKLLAKLKRAFR